MYLEHFKQQHVRHGATPVRFCGTQVLLPWLVTARVANLVRKIATLIDPPGTQMDRVLGKAILHAKK